MDVATAGVLRDVALLVWVALLLGVAAYKWVRMTRPSLSWNHGGHVDARAYISVDAMVVAALALLLLSGLQAADEQAPAAEEDGVLSVSSLVANLLLTLVMCAVLLFYLRVVRNLDPAELFGLRRLGPLRASGLALVFILPALVLVNGTAYGVQQWMQTFWPDVEPQEAVKAFTETSDPLARTLMVVFAAVVAPLVEETIFRGFIYGVIKRFTDSYFAALCSALLFAVVHMHAGSLLPLALLAVVLCLAYEVTGSLLVPILMHAMFNSVSLIALALGLSGEP